MGSEEYVPIYSPAFRHGYKYEHIVIAEKALGKDLPSGAVVHHVNGIKHDNRNENLVICEDGDYHALIHKRMRIVEVGGNPDTDKICTKCRKAKQLEDFTRDRGFPDGRGFLCTSCNRIRAYLRRCKQGCKIRKPYDVSSYEGKAHA